MLNKSSLMSGCLAGVLFFGPISCQKRTETNLDSWNPSDPVLVLSDPNTSIKVQSGAHVFDFSDRVSFLGPHGEDQGIRGIEAQSVCQSEAGEPISDHFALSNSSPRLQDVIPTDLLVPGTKPLDCHFKFILTNDIGSTRTRKLDVIKISPSRPVLVKWNLETPEGENAISVFEEAVDSLRFLDWTGKQGTVTFACESFHVSQTAENIGAVNLRNLIHVNIENLKGADPRYLNSEQLCRFLVRGSDSHLEVSPQLRFRFKPLPMQIHFQEILPDELADLRSQTVRLFKLQLVNPNAVAVAFLIPAAPAPAFAFEIGTWREKTKNGYYTNPYLSPIYFFNSDTNQLFPTKTANLFTINPNSSLNLEARATIDIPSANRSGDGDCVWLDVRYAYRPGMEFSIYRLARVPENQDASSVPVVESTTYFNPQRMPNNGLFPFEIRRKGMSQIIDNWTIAGRPSAIYSCQN